MAERHSQFRRDDTILLSNKMDQDIASAIDRALFHKKAPAHIRIMNAKSNDKGTITAITNQNETPQCPLQYRDIILTAARTVDILVVDVEENESWNSLEIHTVSVI